MTTDTNKERAAFEAWFMKDRCMRLPPARATDIARIQDDLDYEGVAVECCWQGWKARAAPSPEGQADQWISVKDRLPDDRASVAFVVECKGSHFDYLHGRVLGGTYVANQGFGVPGLTIGASHWMPLQAAPKEPT
jgi:hypothetical protein